MHDASENGSVSLQRRHSTQKTRFYDSTLSSQMDGLTDSRTDKVAQNKGYWTQPWSKWFLVACYATLHRALPVRPSVALYFFSVFRSLASLLLAVPSSDLKYCPCPPTRDWGNHVSGLVFSGSVGPTFIDFSGPDRETAGPTKLLSEERKKDKIGQIPPLQISQF